MNKQTPKVSIVVVDYKPDNPLLKACLQAIQNQDYKNYETILLTDFPTKISFPKLIKKSFGKYVGPAIKRDFGVKMAKGEIVVFIDDDAYPQKDWLNQVESSFVSPQIAAVGGPGITPPNSDWKEQLSGWFSASPLGGGPFTYRFLPTRQMEIDDYPSMNLAVRKSDFVKVGGFDSNFWPGEDTKLCLDLVHKLNKKIIYNPKMVVFHHRRPLWKPHFRQNGNFGIHRGHFARILPETSLRLEYFAPSLLLLGLTYCTVYYLLTKAFSLSTNSVFLTVNTICLLGFYLYLVAIILNGLWIFRMSKNLSYGLVSIPVVFLTHLWYGFRFLQGFFSFQKIENSNQ